MLLTKKAESPSLDLIEFSFCNFKCFSQRTTIPLQPLTLILGQNSCGKSSILQILQIMAQTVACGDANRVLLFRSKVNNTDFGTFKDNIFNHETGSRLLQLRFTFANSLEVAELVELHQLIEFSTVSLEVDIASGNEGGDLKVPSFRIYCDDNATAEFTSKFSDEETDASRLEYVAGELSEQLLLNMYRRFKENDEDSAAFCAGTVSALLERFPHLEDPLHKLLHEVVESLYAEEGFETFKHLCFYSRPTVTGLTNFLPTVRKIYTPGREMLVIDSEDDDYVDREIEMEENFDHDRGLSFYGALPNLSLLLIVLSDQIANFLQQASFFGPVRSQPERFWLYAPNVSSQVGRHGELMPATLYRNVALLEKVNKYLDDPLDIGYTVRVETSVIDPELFQIQLRETTRDDAPWINLCDVGYGISQLLPIVVQVALPNFQTIIIEQPELHIHPALQARLGKLFADAIKHDGKKFVVETHSEHLILRLLRLVRQDRLSAQNLCLLSIQKTTLGSRESRIRVNEDGDFIDAWPEGFFPDRLRELLD